MVIHSRPIQKYFYLILFLILGNSIRSQDSLPSIFDYLEKHDKLELTVTTSLKSLLKKKDEYQLAKIEFKSGEKEVLYVEGEIRTRGNVRKEICYVPPTKLRFDKDFLSELGFSTYPTLKLVNACSLKEYNETYVSTENLIYDFNRLFSDLSFRTIPIHIQYVDSDGKKDDMAFKAFIIEHEDQMAARNGGDIYEASLFKEEMLTRDSYLRFAMFQFMIGNTDWKVLNKHNLKILRVMDKRQVHAIAYDFDYSGFVNTHYAVPHETLGIKSVRERMYQGPCLTEEELPKYCAYFIERKGQVMDLIASCDIPEKAKKSCHKYIEDFYAIVEDPRVAKGTFVRCNHE